MATIISHFFNEEFMLPYWLEHHKMIFDHGIMIDYASTDQSCNIIRSICPTWEIRPSRNAQFHYIELDQEVMDIEKTVPGWKMVLNTTEFLIHSDLKNFLATKEAEGVAALRTLCLSMVERLADFNTPLTKDLLVAQKRYGHVDNPQHVGFDPEPGRHRLIHNAPTGLYGCGRHSTEHKSEIHPDLFMYHFFFCPWPQGKERKLQIKDRIPPLHIEQGFGAQHAWSDDEMEKNWKMWTQASINLWDAFPRLKFHVDQLQELHKTCL